MPSPTLEGWPDYSKALSLDEQQNNDRHWKQNTELGDGLKRPSLLCISRIPQSRKAKGTIALLCNSHNTMKQRAKEMDKHRTGRWIKTIFAVEQPQYHKVEGWKNVKRITGWGWCDKDHLCCDTRDKWKIDTELGDGMWRPSMLCSSHSTTKQRAEEREKGNKTNKVSKEDLELEKMEWWQWDE